MPVDEGLAKRCVEVLQEMIDLDREAVTALYQARVPCNEALADHPTVQVGGEPCQVGLLGVLNGICGCYDDGPRKGWGAVSLIVGDDGVQTARLLENRSSK